MNINQIAVGAGGNPKTTILKMLAALDLSGEIKNRGTVLVKPNLVVAKAGSSGATTHVEIVCGLIEYLQDRGIKRITVAESSWTGGNTQKSFQAAGYQALVKRYGISLFDFKKDRCKQITVKDLSLEICSRALSNDYFINMPVLKGHSQTRLTCALKNLKGCIPDSEKRRYHTLGLHKPIAYLNTVIRQDLIIVDGICGDPHSELGGNPSVSNRILVGKDPVLIDSYAARYLGSDPDEIDYILQSAELGVGNPDLRQAEFLEFGKAPDLQFSAPISAVADISPWVREKDACSACYAALATALQKMADQGHLDKLHKLIYIGQGYRGRQRREIGIGECTAGFSDSLQGCPPAAMEIYDYLLNRVYA